LRKLILKVSEKVPDLPEPILREGNLSVKRVKKLHADGLPEGISAYLLDHAFIRKNAEAIKAASLPSGSLLVWSPAADKGLSEGLIPDELIFQEISSFKNHQAFIRTVKNIFRRQFLEKELARKEEILKARIDENDELLMIGIALSAERDNDRLLSYILQQLRNITRADAGTLFLLEKDDKGDQVLHFKISQTDSNPRDYTEFTVPLSKKSISGYVASTGEVLNIEDAYKIPPGKEYGFSKSFDQETGYRSKSMLTVPMTNHKGEILGVIQLINRKGDAGQLIPSAEETDKYVIPFSKDVEPVVLSLASQAAVSLENNLLYQEIETLFEGFVKASVQAIESRDPTTSGHSNRVAVYTVGLAEALERAGSGQYRDIHFTREQLKEIRYASLLHDFGKVGVREHVLVKAKKLYPPQLEMVKMRFAYIQKSIVYSIMKERFDALCNGGMDGYLKVKAEFDAKEQEHLSELERYLNTIVATNEPTVLSENPSMILDEIHGKTFLEKGGQALPFLTEDEYIKLKIPMGSLDESERKEIESHVTHTFLFLRTIPWTKEMKNIPQIAFGHHEKLDGEGYPRGIRAEEIPIQTRMMTVSDIFDALTAMDRPYKRAIPPQKALDILRAEVGEKKLDPDLVKVFIESKIWDKKPDAAGK
jgi:HD-GYP domain-containing protein (c-di-GMP phosphodiesterase class II)